MSTWIQTLQQPVDLRRCARQLAQWWPLASPARRAARQRQALLARRRARRAAAAAEDSDAIVFAGCGWYGSSHELNQGLEVQEHDDGAVWANALPLDVWVRQLGEPQTGQA